MNTAFDWVTMIIFAGLVTRFLHQSVAAEGDDRSMWHYLVPSIGCALANWLGNEGWTWAAIALIAATFAYIVRFLVPPRPWPRDH